MLKLRSLLLFLALATLSSSSPSFAFSSSGAVLSFHPSSSSSSSRHLLDQPDYSSVLDRHPNSRLPRSPQQQRQQQEETLQHQGKSSIAQHVERTKHRHEQQEEDKVQQAQSENETKANILPEQSVVPVAAVAAVAAASGPISDPDDNRVVIISVHPRGDVDGLGRSLDRTEEEATKPIDYKPYSHNNNKLTPDEVKEGQNEAHVLSKKHADPYYWYDEDKLDTKPYNRNTLRDPIIDFTKESDEEDRPRREAPVYHWKEEDDGGDEERGGNEDRAQEELQQDKSNLLIVLPESNSTQIIQQIGSIAGTTGVSQSRATPDQPQASGATGAGAGDANPFIAFNPLGDRFSSPPYSIDPQANTRGQSNPPRQSGPLHPNEMPPELPREIPQGTKPGERPEQSNQSQFIAGTSREQEWRQQQQRPMAQQPGQTQQQQQQSPQGAPASGTEAAKYIPVTEEQQKVNSTPHATFLAALHNRKHGNSADLQDQPRASVPLPSQHSLQREEQDQTTQQKNKELTPGKRQELEFQNNAIGVPVGSNDETISDSNEEDNSIDGSEALDNQHNGKNQLYTEFYLSKGHRHHPSRQVDADDNADDEDSDSREVLRELDLYSKPAEPKYADHLADTPNGKYQSREEQRHQQKAKERASHSKHGHRKYEAADATLNVEVDTAASPPSSSAFGLLFAVFVLLAAGMGVVYGREHAARLLQYTGSVDSYSSISQLDEDETADLSYVHDTSDMYKEQQQQNEAKKGNSYQQV